MATKKKKADEVADGPHYVPQVSTYTTMPFPNREPNDFDVDGAARKAINALHAEIQRLEELIKTVERTSRHTKKG